MGGNTSTDGARFSPLSDLWRLDLTARAWSRVTVANGPSARLFHAMTLRGRRLTVFGGGGANAFTGPFLRDLWTLDLDAMAWTRHDVRGATDELLGRISASLAADPEGEGFLLVGGHDDGPLGNRNDVLAFTADGEVSVLRAGDTLGTRGSGFCDFPEDFAVTDDDSPGAPLGVHPRGRPRARALHRVRRKDRLRARGRRLGAAAAAPALGRPARIVRGPELSTLRPRGLLVPLSVNLQPSSPERIGVTMDSGPKRESWSQRARPVPLILATSCCAARFNRPSSRSRALGSVGSGSAKRQEVLPSGEITSLSH